MSSEGENSKDLSAEVDQASAGAADGDSSEDSQGKGVKSEANDKGSEKSADDENTPIDKPSEGAESKDKKDGDVKKESKAEASEESKNKEDKEKKSENNESKTDNDTEEGDDSGKEDEGSKKEDKKGVPLLDQPLEQSGTRERKKVQRFNEDLPADSKEAKLEIPSGTGTQLGEIPRIDASISRFKNDDLKLLHRLLYRMPGKTTLIKKNIKKFNGFDFKKDSEEYNVKLESAKKFELKQLKSICEMLDLEKKGVKDEIVQRIIEFLLEPKDSGKPVGGGRPKRTAAVRANNRGYSSHDDSYSSDERRTRGGRGKGKRTNLKDDSTSESDEEFHPSDASESRPRVIKRKRGGRKKADSEDEEGDNDVSDVESATSEDSDEEPRKRKKNKKVPNNKAKGKATPKPRGRKPAAETEKKATAAPPPKKGGRKRDRGSSEESEPHAEDNASSSEDEPLIKKAKSPQPPTDEEIKKYVKEILDGANLEEITMKTVCKQVYAHYPDFDLAHKKDFIKTTVKSLIST